MQNAIDILNEIAEKNNLKIIYATLFGSRLYGTELRDAHNNTLADIDIKAVFVPDIKKVILGTASKHITFKTSDDLHRNTSNDIDIELYSIHKFLSMVARGETGSLDLLFSFTNKEATILKTEEWRYIENNLEKFFNPQNTKAFFGYCLGQVNRYNLRGSRLDALDKVIDITFDYINSLESPEAEKLKPLINIILSEFENSTFVIKDSVVAKDTYGDRTVGGIRILGSLHLEEIFVEDFYNRLLTTRKKYGKRSEAAKSAGGADWKAISHGLRVAMEVEELVTTGTIQFPIAYANTIKKIKAGNVSLEETGDMLSAQIEKVDTLINEGNIIENKFDSDFIADFVLSLYSYGDNT